MNRFVFVVLVALAVSASLSAQQAPSFLNVDRIAIDRVTQPAFLTAAGSGDSALVPVLLLPAAGTMSFAGTAPAPSAALSASPAPLPNAPAPPPAGGDFGTRWDLGVGYEFVHFNSKPFSANLNGLHTSIAYALDDWVALEGSVVSAFGTHVFADEQSRYALITGGARVSWNRDPRHFSPWAHVLVGFAHVNPQVADTGKNGFALQTGGGVDYFFNPRLSFRAEADYVMTKLYSETQNNVQAGAGIVIHF